MSKFHINKHGVPAVCKATKGNCPYGGESGSENHFDTQEEAQEHANKAHEAEHSILPGVNESGMGDRSLQGSLENGKVKAVIGEKYNVIFEESEDGTFDSEEMKLMEIHKHKGKEVYVFQDSSPYPMATYNHSGNIDWDFMEEIQDKYAY